MSGFTDPDPWAAAPVSLYRNQDLNPQLLALRQMVIQQREKERKLEAAIYQRLLGLASMHYEQIRRAKLAALLAKRPQGNTAW